MAGSVSKAATTLKAALGEAPVVAQGLAEVAGPDDSDVVLAVEPELAVDLLAEELGVVADAPGAVGTELGQVLADLGRVYAGAGGQFL